VKTCKHSIVKRILARIGKNKIKACFQIGSMFYMNSQEVVPDSVEDNSV